MENECPICRARRERAATDLNVYVESLEDARRIGFRRGVFWSLVLVVVGKLLLEW